MQHKKEVQEERNQPNTTQQQMQQQSEMDTSCYLYRMSKCYKTDPKEEMEDALKKKTTTNKYPVRNLLQLS